ncbi:MAG: hypothetical protein ACXWQQ_01510 [Pseudobdellovibrio sp.]
MQPQNEKQTQECHNEETAAKLLIEEGRKLQTEGHRMVEQDEKIVQDGKEMEEKGKRLLKELQEDKEKQLFIFINHLRIEKGVHKKMTDDEIARLVGLTGDTAVVRRLMPSGDASDPLVGEIHIKAGDQFIVTRKRVEGGYQDRINKELSLLQEGALKVEFHAQPTPCVIYRKVPIGKGKGFTDVLVQVPNGYPGAMIDRAGLPEGTSIVGQVKGQPQEVIQVAGQAWRLMSYHPHTNGGGLPWNQSVHGFHTYLYEILSWLEAGR